MDEGRETGAALDGLDEVDWGSLKHAYGSAEDVPQALRDVASDDLGVANEASEHLFSSIYHQGTLYTATPKAVPFIVRLATQPRSPRRLGMVSLLAAIAASGDAEPQVLADVDAALAAEVAVLLPLLDDPDAETRHVATYLLGNLPRECADEVVPALRARRGRERSPRVLAGLLAAAGRLAPESGDWFREELASARPSVRAGALWAIADAGLPWSDEATEAVVSSWLNGEPLEAWIWADDPFDDIVSGLGGEAFAGLCRTLFERGTADSARAAIDAAYQRCVRSRSAREDVAPLLAAGIDHADMAVRVAAVTAVRDVPAAAPAAADSLAAYLADPPAAVVEDVNSNEARFFDAALEILIVLGDPRWREPFMAALVAGTNSYEAVGLLIDTKVACDPDLLGAVRRRLAAMSGEGPPTISGYDGLLARNLRHNELSALTRLLRHWGQDATEAIPELTALVPQDDWWAVRALDAIGPVASAAVPALTLRRDDPEASWGRRLEAAEALAAITGDVAQLSACVIEAAANGAAVPAAETATRHDLPLDGLLPALRDIASTDEEDDPSVIRDSLDAARLLADAGEIEAPMRAVANALDNRRQTTKALEVAGSLGPAAADLVPRLSDLLDDRHAYSDAALALWRVTGEAAPLVEAVRRRLDHLGAGRWIFDALRELGPEAAPLLPKLRELVHGDAAIGGTGIYGRQARQDDEERSRLLAIVAELEIRR
ncbi:hypothetical protein [Spirillospora sp. NPDC047279]|uniref:hypothetical protein n=1 Tax=Spirillospora sp. NPDC047279 TaxID=3155478 RepID=UPI0033C23A3F